MDETLKSLAGLGLDTVGIRGMVETVREEAASLDGASAETIIGTRWCWNLRDDDDGTYSTQWMSDDELAEAVVEDLINVMNWRLKGKEVGGDVVHLTRFLSGESAERAKAVFEHPFVKSVTFVAPDGSVELDPEHLQDAMDFCGVWLDGWDPLTAEAVYKAGRFPE